MTHTLRCRDGHEWTATPGRKQRRYLRPEHRVRSYRTYDRPTCPTCGAAWLTRRTK